MLIIYKYFLFELIGIYRKKSDINIVIINLIKLLRFYVYLRYIYCYVIDVEIWKIIFDI